MTAARPWILAESTFREVDPTRYDVVVLPWGATEAHNYHLPYATDNYEAEAVAVESARLAWARGARVVVLPTIPFGVQTGQRDIKLCVNLNPSTQHAILRDLVASIDAHGVGKLVIVNGHGGNDFRQMIRELQPSTSMLLATINWWQVVDATAYFEEPGDHAGALETGAMLHLRPDLVRPLDQAGPGHERRPTIAGFRERWAWTPRPWTQVSADTGIGNPAGATAERGAAHFAAVTTRIGEFLVDLAAADPANLYS